MDQVLDVAELVALECDQTTLPKFELREPSIGVGFRRRDGVNDCRGQNPLGQIVVAAVVDPVGNKQAAVEKKFLQSGFGERGGRAPTVVIAFIIVDFLG